MRLWRYSGRGLDLRPGVSYFEQRTVNPSWPNHGPDQAGWRTEPQFCMQIALSPESKRSLSLLLISDLFAITARNYVYYARVFSPFTKPQSSRLLGASYAQM